MASEREIVIRECSCKHDYQDKVYGKQMRVHNPKKAPAGSKPRVTCTVCGTVKEPQ